eukprot:s1551_g14.t1
MDVLKKGDTCHGVSNGLLQQVSWTCSKKAILAMVSAMAPEFRIEDVYANSTTLIMRGLKRNITREMFVALLDETCDRQGMYDYIYVPWTTDGASNIGLGFANFVSPRACKEYLLGLKTPENEAKLHRGHVRSIGPAAIQGRGSNLKALLGKRGQEALRGFDAPLVFHQGGPACVAHVAEREIPGGLEMALDATKDLSTSALTSEDRSRRFQSTLQAANYGSGQTESARMPSDARYSWRFRESGRVTSAERSLLPTGDAGYPRNSCELPWIRIEVPAHPGAPAIVKTIFEL